MYDVRVSPRLKQKLLDAYERSDRINKNLVKVHEDKAVTDSVGALVMIHTSKGELVEWGFRGARQIQGFLELGYMPVRKFCPLLKRVCVGEKCAFHLVQYDVGDCALLWGGIKAK